MCWMRHDLSRHHYCITIKLNNNINLSMSPIILVHSIIIIVFRGQRQKVGTIRTDAPIVLLACKLLLTTPGVSP